MATITNHEAGPLILPTGHRIEPWGTLVMDNDMIRQPDIWSSLVGRALAGHISIVFDPEPDPADPERLIVPVAPTPPAPAAVLRWTDSSPAESTDRHHDQQQQQHSTMESEE